MSQNDICPNCKLTLSPNHTLVGFDSTGTPEFKCHRDPKLGPDAFLEGANLLWERLEAAEASATSTGSEIEKKTAALKEAATRIAKLDLANSQQSLKIEKLEKDLAQAKAEKTSAVAEAVKEIETEMGADLKKAQSVLEKLSEECGEKLTFKDKCLAESAAEVAALRKDKDGLTAALISANLRADEYESRANDAEARVLPLETANAALQKKGLKQAKANLELVDKIGELKGRVDEITLVCKDNGLAVSEIVFEVLPVAPEQVIEESVIVPLSKMRRPIGAAQEVQPSAPAASSAPAPEIPPPPPAAPPPVPAAVVAVTHTDTVCMICGGGKPAVKVAKDKWRKKDGTMYEPLYSCVKLGSHVDDFFQVLDGDRDQLENPPGDSFDLLSEFEDIATTVN